MKFDQFLRLKLPYEHMYLNMCLMRSPWSLPIRLVFLPGKTLRETLAALHDHMIAGDAAPSSICPRQRLK